MNFTKTFIIEASRENSREAEQIDLEGDASTKNASWSNNVNDFFLHAGDEISIHSTAIHSVGFATDGVVEITGNADSSTSLTDNVVGIEGQVFVNNNGYNDVMLPYCGFLQEDYWVANPDGAYTPTNNINCFNAPNQAMPINPSPTSYNYGAPVGNENTFKFSYDSIGTGNITGHAGISPAYIRTCFFLPKSENVFRDGILQFSYTNEKFVKLSNTYKGPYRTNDSYGDDDAATFADDEDSCQPMLVSTILNVDAPIYESPTTITNKLNGLINQTYPMTEAPPDSVIPMSEGRMIPHVSSNLLKVVNCNGSGTTDNDLLPWSQLCVRSLPKWKSIHAMMRCSLAFNGQIDGDPTHRLGRPVIFFNSLGMNQNWRTTHNDPVQSNQHKGFFPRSTKKFAVSTDGIGDIDLDAIYSIIPRYYLISTNIKYNAANIARIKVWFEQMEKYNGHKTTVDEIESDYSEWSVEADLGSSKDGINTSNTPTGKYGGSYAPYGHEVHKLSHGYVLGNYDTSQLSSYAFSMPLEGYSSEIDDLGGCIPTPRSDFPESRYSNYHFNSSNSYWQRYSISSISEDVPHRFKDNLNKNCNMRLFSRMNPAWKSLYRTNNFPDPNKKITDYDGVEGIGEWIHPPESVDEIDTSLSGNLGVYGVKIVDANSDGDLYYWNLDDCYFVGEYNSWADGRNFPWAEGGRIFCYHIQVATSGSDQETYGGYELLWHDYNAQQWNKQDDVYIYSSKNYRLKGGHPDPSTQTYDGGKAYDLFSKDFIYIVKEGADASRWIGIMTTDYIDSTRQNNAFNLYYCDQTADKSKMEPFALPNDDEFVLQIIIQTTDGGYNGTGYPSSNWSSNANNPAVNNKNPTIGENPSETVCCFMTYAPSGTFNDDGSTVISTDNALPQIYNGLFFGPSPSFLDSPASWLLNQMGSGSIDSDNVINYVNVGCSNPTIEYDAAQSRSTIFNLSNNALLGVNQCPGVDDSGGTLVVDNLGNPISRFNDTSYPFYSMYNFQFGNQSVDWQGANPTTGIYMSTSGIALTAIYGQYEGQLKTTVDDMIELDSEEKFKNSLLYKLGFRFSDFFTPYGSFNDVLHDPAVQGSLKDGELYLSMKPITTNYSLSATQQPFMALMEDAPNSDANGLATYMLGFPGLKENFNLGSDISTQIVASNLPTKDDSPYFLIYSDIVSTDYYTKETKTNIVGIIPKFYSGGDYVYGTDSGITFTNLLPRPLSSIKTEIRNPSGQLSAVNGKSSVIYKITRQITQPTVSELGQEIMKEMEKEQTLKEKK